MEWVSYSPPDFQFGVGFFPATRYSKYLQVPIPPYLSYIYIYIYNLLKRLNSIKIARNNLVLLTLQYLCAMLDYWNLKNKTWHTWSSLFNTLLPLQPIKWKLSQHQFLSTMEPLNLQATRNAIRVWRRSQNYCEYGVRFIIIFIFPFISQFFLDGFGYFFGH